MVGVTLVGLVHFMNVSSAVLVERVGYKLNVHSNFNCLVTNAFFSCFVPAAYEQGSRVEVWLFFSDCILLPLMQVQGKM